MRNIRKWLVRRKNKKAENEELFMPHIRLTNAHDKSCVYEYDLEGCMVVGRAPDLCDVALVDEPTVSARQCRLYTVCGKVYLMDLDGTNPTYHNNLKVIEDVALRNGDVISFGEVDLYVEMK